MDKIFHVFVSSTYLDLIEERKKVSEAVAKAGYVAEGMEIFPASSQKQMDFIGRVIDRCDYYILVVAGRYGSVDDDGLSFTEKEFLYAQSNGIPVLAFIRNDLNKLPKDQTEDDPEKQRKLQNFLSELQKNSVVDLWSTPDELSTKALAALSQARVSHEGIGWIRANNAADVEILSEVNELRKENNTLKSKLSALKPSPIFDDIELANLDSEFDFTLRIVSLSRIHSNSNCILTLSWREILAVIGPHFRTPANTSKIDTGIVLLARKKLNIPTSTSINLDSSEKEQVLIQMEALGMMKAEPVSLKVGGQEIFHSLTEKGLSQMLRENVVKSPDNIE